MIRVSLIMLPIEHDEAKTHFAFVSRGWIQVLSDYYVPNNHILYSALAKTSISAFGDNLAALRLPALLAGCLALPVVYAVARRLYSARAALIALGLCAVSVPLIEYSDRARGYSIVTLMTLTAFLFADSLAHRRAAVLWGGWIAACAIGLWAVPTMAWSCALTLLWLFVRTRKADRRALIRSSLVALVVLGVAASVLYAPVILRYRGIRPLVSNPYVAPVSLAHLTSGIGLAGYELLAWTGSGNAFGGPILNVVCVLLAMVMGATERRTTSRILCVTILGGLTVLCFVQRVVPPTRTLLFVVPFLLLLTAEGLDAVVEAATVGRGRALALLGALGVAWLAVSSLRVTEGIKRGCASVVFWNAQEYAQFLKPRLSEAAVVTSTPASAALRYYLTKERVPASAFIWHDTTKSINTELDGAERVFAVICPSRYGLSDLGMGSESEFGTPVIMLKDEQCELLAFPAYHPNRVPPSDR